MKHLFSIVFALIFGFAFSQTPQMYNFPKVKSSITMPVRIPLAEVSKMINSSVKDLIFEDNSNSDNNNDQFQVKVWKTKPIRLVGDAKKNIFIEVPLKIWAKKGIGTLGVYTYQETTFETVMYFVTSIDFKNNWTVATKTNSNGFKWVVKPVLDFGRIKIPITGLVEKSLKEQQAEFCKTIDVQMVAQLNFQQYAILAWNSFSQPFKISDEYSTWLKVTPTNVNIAPLRFYGDAIDTTIGIDIFSETFTGVKPEASQPIKTAMNFSYVPLLNEGFLLQTTANIPFSEATEIARKTFLNKEFDVRDSKVKITDVKVYKDGGNVIIETETDGYVKGKSLISGIPVYDKTKNKIVLSQTKFKLKTANIIQKTASLMFQGKIVKMIEEEYGIPTQDLEVSSQKSIEEAFNKEYYKGLKMQGRVFHLAPSQIIVNDYGITAVIDIQAGLRLMLNSFL
ncbi:protein of unknown function [Chryseobacterium piscicola]|uniref:DUF4403 domain-containing protein n=1 Tax=Chryseobacterium piscicola TaxID=551459 RepID=A0A1N7ML38_9FLAO|nr:DUF4403 family protein [Chryseobacterium piscicola]PQA90290.1 hypothetical protein B0A70_14710 [Chryseobacterium piscicola]SIS86817.1 protein of unknown function [Chryseobacterium piscicola]